MDKPTESPVVEGKGRGLLKPPPISIKAAPPPSVHDLTVEEKAMIDSEPEVFMRNVSEAKNKNSEHPKRPYCTTSSVYAEHTISNPDNDQVNYCIAAILQAQIFDDVMNPSFAADGHKQTDAEAAAAAIMAPELSHEPAEESVPESSLTSPATTTTTITTTTPATGSTFSSPPMSGSTGAGDRSLMAEFQLDIALPAEYGGEIDEVPEHVLNHETLGDLELREKLLSLEVPTVDTIYRFISMLIGLAKFSLECNILALVYVNRMTGRNSIPMTMRNWRGLWVSAIILAQKVWDDQPLRTASFARILPNVTREQLRALEMLAFRALDYNTTVKPSVYAKYYFELRQIFKEIAGNDPRYTWNIQPLSLAEGRRLELRSSKPNGDSSEPTGRQQRAASSSAATSPKNSGRTLEDATFVKNTRYVIS